jgi:hypothetical protein
VKHPGNKPWFEKDSSCAGPHYGYHAAGYHPTRQRAAERSAALRESDHSTKVTEAKS